MIERLGSGGPYEDVVGYSRVVRAGDWAITAGCTAVVDGVVAHVGDAEGQARAALDLAVRSLERSGCARAGVVHCRMYLRDAADTDAVGRAHRAVLGDVRPASTMLVVAGFVDPAMLVEVELTGWCGP